MVRRIRPLRGLPFRELSLKDRNSYLSSPIIEIVAGSGDAQVAMNAHQALLVKSPYLKSLIDAFTDGTAVSQLDLTQRWSSRY